MQSETKTALQLEALEQLIKTRRSIREYQDRDVPDDLLRRAVEIAAFAPNGGNYQPYKLVAVKRRELIDAIADAVRDKAELIASWPEVQAMGAPAERWRDSVAFFRAAPVVICCFVGDYASMADRVLRVRGANDPAAREMIDAREFGSSRIQSLATTLGYLALVLHALGLGAVYMTAPLQAKREIEQLLGVVENLHLAAVMPVGYPAEEKGVGTRKPVDEVMEIVR